MMGLLFNVVWQQQVLLFVYCYSHSWCYLLVSGCLSCFSRWFVNKVEILVVVNATATFLVCCYNCNAIQFNAMDNVLVHLYIARLLHTIAISSPQIYCRWFTLFFFVFFFIIIIIIINTCAMLRCIEYL